jgi:hypothetical protein
LLLSLSHVYRSSCVRSFFIDFLSWTFISLFIPSNIYLSYLFSSLLISFLHPSFFSRSLFLEKSGFSSFPPHPQRN